MSAIRIVFTLTLIVTWTARPASAQDVEAVSFGDEMYHGIRALPDYDVTGTYLYEGEGEPSVVLEADGTGAFAHHGRAPLPIRWWIQADEGGEPVTQAGEIGQAHNLLVEFAEVPPGSDTRFRRMQLTIRYDLRQMFILGERAKPY